MKFSVVGKQEELAVSSCLQVFMILVESIGDRLFV